MAALCPGVQYGLSSQQNFGENKDYIFVKLTDSALRAIEEFIKNQNKFSCQSPTIKFLGNENGELSFPSVSGSTSFQFSMSSTADMEGPGGSFECIQQIGPPRGSLESLGSIPRKIRIHANEDVYEVTRNRMTEAEDKYKNKCTREIKPNQTDIGRKVKVKQAAGRMLPQIPAVRREMPSMRESLLKQPSSYQPHPHPQPPVKMPSSNGLSNGLGSNHVSSSRPQLNKPSVPDIARRPLKERLIHLLALRPFKKVELYERLTKEGLREKMGMSSVLKQISSLKDNCYHLNRAMWNEVQDDWQFYTESEKQMLKRRKPQNLTPPGSSDGGSSGSGQSPTSTHPGSPPPITSSKRPGFYDGSDGIPTKRQRVSHYRKPAEPAQQYRPPLENNSQRRPITDSRDASNMNPRSRESPTPTAAPTPTPTTNGYVNGYANGMLNDKRNFSDDEDSTANKKRSCDSHNSIGFGVSREKTFVNGNKYNNKVTSSTALHNRIARVSPDSQTETLLANLDVPQEKKKKAPPIELEEDDDLEYPDFRSQYTTIRNVEQRRRYKADFNADYAEYRDLHGIVEKVSRKFAQLEERLKQEDERSPEYKDIKNQIIKEYHENKKDLGHQKAKKRFNYLHEKLSHIKRLVFEFDKNVTDSQY